MEDLMLIEILKEMQKKYQCIVEIERITREMGDSLSRNDKVSVQMLLIMRQEEMEKADDCEKRIRRLLSVLTPQESDQIRRWMKGESLSQSGSFASEKLIEKGNNIQNILKRTIEIDRHICTRLAGNKSYYK